MSSSDIVDRQMAALLVARDTGVRARDARAYLEQRDERRREQGLPT